MALLCNLCGGVIPDVSNSSVLDGCRGHYKQEISVAPKPYPITNVPKSGVGGSL